MEAADEIHYYEIIYLVDTSYVAPSFLLHY